MRWRDKRRSTNIEDRRGRRSGGLKIGGLGFILLFIVFLFLGQNPLQLLDMDSSSSSQQTSTQDYSNDTNAAFVSTILASTEDAWAKIFKDSGYRYAAPKLVLFDDQISSACGFTTSATGPFYCPADSKVYLDLGFFRELEAMGARGDFARAYVIAHEIGHHIQNLTGVSAKSQILQQRISKIDANQVSVLTELQADCYAGVWIHHYEKQRSLLENGDIEEGIRAAASIGDDRLQRHAGRRVNPDAFTHGSAKQRTEWFTLGMRHGSIKQCDTFAKAGIRL